MNEASSDINPLLAKEKKTWFGFFLKLAFFLGALVLVLLTVLANMGGNGDHLKKMVEEFASETTGYTARLEKLNNVTFFPSVSFDFEDMGLFRHAESKVSIGHVDRVRMAFGFWDVFLGRGRIRDVNVINLHADAGTFLAQPLIIKSVGIIDTVPGQGRFEGSGTIGSEPFDIAMDMQSWGSGRTKTYAFAERRTLVMNLSELGLSSILQNGTNPYIRFEDFKLTHRNGTVASGTIDLSKRRAHELTITGELTLEPHKTILKPDLILDLHTWRLSGTIRSNNFNPKDAAAGSLFASWQERALEILTDPARDTQFLDNFFVTNSVTLDLSGEARYQGPLVFKNNRLALTPGAD